ncbi:hypothetical protein HDV02_005649 [Globomyces sp. JEL0801]|nr:hypothetical protein HDV02_005649 [Globomyces sp. JEL0801]
MTEVVFEAAGRRSVPNPVETVNSQPATHAPTTPRTTSTGQRVGPYILGRVKLAVHMETNHKVAIKIINKDSGEVDPKKMAAELKKLEREITIMKLIQHPNILQIYDVYETSKELTRRGWRTIRLFSEKGAITRERIISIFPADSIWGRILSSTYDMNLLLDKDHNVKVADFGMANMQIQKTKMLETSCGSPHYASPEIIRGDKYNGPTSDVWSCGIILYALVTGNLPFDDNNIRRLLNKLSEVLRNEWFLSREPKIPIPNITSAVEESVQDYDQNYKFEEDLMASLALLGCTDRAELHKALLAPGKNAEKIFYNLLQKRKWEILENYNSVQTEKFNVEEGGPVRRADSFVSDGGDTPPKSAAKKENAPQHNRRAISEGNSVKKSSSVKYNSPLVAEIRDVCVPDSPKPGETSTSAQAEAETVADEASVTPVIIAEKVPPKKSMVGGKRKGPLQINTAGSSDGGEKPLSSAGLGSAGLNSPSQKSPALHQAFMAITLGTPKFHRRVGLPGMIKCKVDSAAVNGDNPNDKVLKFKIEIVPDESDALKLRVQFIHQQGDLFLFFDISGSFTTFQVLVQKLLAGWVTHTQPEAGLNPNP